MKITVYSRPTCAPCQSLKTFLKKKGLEYINRNIDEDVEAAAEAFAYTGQSIVPVTVVEKDGERQVVAGFNLSQLAPALR